MKLTNGRCEHRMHHRRHRFGHHLVPLPGLDDIEQIAAFRVEMTVGVSEAVTRDQVERRFEFLNDLCVIARKSLIIQNHAFMPE